LSPGLDDEMCRDHTDRVVVGRNHHPRGISGGSRRAGVRPVREYRRRQDRTIEGPPKTAAMWPDGRIPARPHRTGDGTL